MEEFFRQHNAFKKTICDLKSTLANHVVVCDQRILAAKKSRRAITSLLAAIKKKKLELAEGSESKNLSKKQKL